MIKTKFPKEHFFYVSNILSIARIILIAPFVYVLSLNTPTANTVMIALGIIIILTDYFDGFFSRKLNQVTELGKFLDPLADKIAMAVLLLALIIYRDFPITLVILLVLRDLLILAFGIIITKKKEVPVSNWWGKVNTVVISFAGLFFILDWDTYLFTLLYFASYLTIIISAVSYYRVGEKIFFVKRGPKYTARILSSLLSIIILSFILSLDFTSFSTPYRIEAEFENKDQLIRKYAPVLYFAEGEPFFPIDVQSFLDHSKLMKRSAFFIFDSEIEDSGPLLEKMSKYNDKSCYLKIDRGLFDGIEDKYNKIKDKYRVTVYANAFKVHREEKPVYILQYWFFYWGSCAGNTGFVWHECDWEMVMFYLDENFKPEKAGYSQHYNGEVKKWEDIEKEDGHPVVYAAYGSHGSYFNKGKFRAYYDNNRKMPLGGDSCSGDIKLDPSNYTITPIDGSTAWINFKGYWGIPIVTKLPGPQYRNPKNKTLTMWYNPIGWFKKYDPGTNF